MDFIIREYTRYASEEILPLYESVGWVNYTNNPQMLENAYRHSLKIFAAYAEDKPVGIIRAVGDGFSVVFIQDLLVYPAHQGKGVGTALLDRMLKEYPDVYQFHLLTDNTEKTVQFYKSRGFCMDSDMGCCAFSRM
ncbi:MAG: GNAT family N-acetyltransferase [Clostridia bacterium]|nr:GNAT family N-acetyltransferase [Clostridia bacterium]